LIHPPHLQYKKEERTLDENTMMNEIKEITFYGGMKGGEFMVTALLDDN
jgi:hypothetical protein